MFGTLTNLARAAVSVAVAPVALVVDVVTLPESALDPHRHPFERTGALLKNAGRCVDAAIAPVSKDAP